MVEEVPPEAKSVLKMSHLGLPGDLALAPGPRKTDPRAFRKGVHLQRRLQGVFRL